MSSPIAFAAAVVRCSVRCLWVLNANIIAALQDLGEMVEEYEREEIDLEEYQEEWNQRVCWLYEHQVEWVVNAVWLAGALAYLRTQLQQQQGGGRV